MTLDEAILHAEEVADKCALTDGNIQCENDHRQLAEWLKELKQLREQTGWIPVSERLPNIGQRVLVTTETLDNGKNVTGTYYDRYGFVCGNVLAWMPLPEPYKAESEE